MEAKSRFLWAASKLFWEISNGTNSHKSDLDAITNELRVRNDSYLEIQKDKFYLCPKCSTPWREGRFTMRVRGVKVKKKMKKWIHIKPADMSSYKKKLLDSYKSKRDNVMVLRCQFCQHVTKCNITKQRSKILSNIVTKTENQSNLKSHSEKKKKKKKKDVLAGLKIEGISKKIKNNALDIYCKETKSKDLEVNASNSVYNDKLFSTIIDKETEIKELSVNSDQNDPITLNVHISGLVNDSDTVATHKNQIFARLNTKFNTLLNEGNYCKTLQCLRRNDNVNLSSNNVLKVNSKCTKSTDNNSKKYYSVTIQKSKRTEINNLKNKKKKKMVSVPTNIKQLKSELKDFINSL